MRKDAGESGPRNGTGALLKEQNYKLAERFIDSKLIAKYSLGEKFRDTSHFAIILGANDHNFCFTQSFHTILVFHDLLVA